jgi:hypothetical protein
VEAEKQLTAGYEILAKQASPNRVQFQEARQDLVTLYDALKEPDRAAQFRSKMAAAVGGLQCHEG